MKASCSLAVSARTSVLFLARRSESTCNAIVGATCLPDPLDALTEVRSVALDALAASWDNASALFDSLLDCGGCSACSNTFVAAAFSGLAAEDQWLRALVQIADDTIRPGRRRSDAQDAVKGLNAAFASVT